MSEEEHEIFRRSSGILAEPSRPRIVYITPDNIDQVIEQFTVPSHRELKRRKRPFTIFVEGIVGTGKSTFLEPFTVSLNLRLREFDTNCCVL